jgi:hypothetical protein
VGITWLAILGVSDDACRKYSVSFQQKSAPVRRVHVLLEQNLCSKGFAAVGLLRTAACDYLLHFWNGNLSMILIVICFVLEGLRLCSGSQAEPAMPSSWINLLGIIPS